MHVLRIWRAWLMRAQRIDVRAGPPAAAADLGRLALPASGEDGFYLLTAELKDSSARKVSRSFYWIRYLMRMGEPAFRDAYRARPQSTFALPEGPPVKEAIEGRATTLETSSRRPRFGKSKWKRCGASRARPRP